MIPDTAEINRNLMLCIFKFKLRIVMCNYILKYFIFLAFYQFIELLDRKHGISQWPR